MKHKFFQKKTLKSFLGWLFIFGGMACGNKTHITPPPLPKPEPVKNLISEVACGKITLKWTPSVFNLQAKPLENPADYLVLRRRGEQIKPQPTPEAPAATEILPAEPAVSGPEYEFRLIGFISGKPVSAQDQSNLAYQIKFEDNGLTGIDYLPSERFKQPKDFPPKPTDLSELKDGYVYYYKIIAIGSNSILSDPSQILEIKYEPIPVPLDQIIISVLETGVKIQWTPPDFSCNGMPLPELGGFYIERATAEIPDKFSLVVALEDPTAVSYQDSTIEKDTKYLYRLGSFTKAGRLPSKESQTIEVDTTDTFAPQAPENLRAAVTMAGIRLIWDSNPEKDVAGYRVYRADSSNGPFKLLNDDKLLPDNSYADSSAKSGEFHVYYVTAVDSSKSANESKPSDSRAIILP